MEPEAGGGEHRGQFSLGFAKQPAGVFSLGLQLADEEDFRLQLIQFRLDLGRLGGAAHVSDDLAGSQAEAEFVIGPLAPPLRAQEALPGEGDQVLRV